MLPSDIEKRWVPHLHTSDPKLLGEFKGTIEDAAGSASVLLDGRSLAFGEANGAVRKIDLETGLVLWTGKELHTPVLQTLACSQDGRILATGGEDGYVFIWNPVDGECTGKLQHPAGVNEVSFSPTGSLLAAACCDNIMHIWDIETMSHIVSCEGHDAWVVTVAWSPDGMSLVSGSNDGTLRFWNAADGMEMRCMNFETKPLSVSWWNRDALLAVGCGNGRVSVFRVDTLDEVVCCLGHEGEVNRVRWSRDGRILATGGDDQTLRLWHAETGREVYRFDFEEKFVWDLSWSPNNAFLAVSLCGDRVILLDVRKFVD